MLTRQYGYLWANPQQDDVSSAAKTLETEGACVLRAAFTLAEVDELRRAIDQVFSDYAPDQRSPSRTAAADSEFRYEILNRSLACLAAVAKPEILAAIEPLWAKIVTLLPIRLGETSLNLMMPRKPGVLMGGLTFHYPKARLGRAICLIRCSPSAVTFCYKIAR